MKIDFNAKITTLSGKTMKAQDGVMDLTMGEACIGALLTLLDEKKVSGPERKKRADLADKIYDKTEPVVLDVKEVSLIHDLVGELYPPLVVKRVWDLLDPPEAAPQEVASQE